MSLADREREKYEKVWTFDNYRHHSPGEQVVDRAISSLGMKPGHAVVDYGCGTGRAAMRFLERGLMVAGVDIAHNCLDPDLPIPLTVACLWELTDRPTSDWAFCTDVMEHIPPEHVADVFAGIAGRSSGAFFQICTSRDGFGKRLVGEPLHLTVKPANWWTEQAKVHWGDVTVETMPAHVELTCR